MKKLSPLLTPLLIITILSASIFPLFTPRAEAIGTISNILPSSTSVALLQCANQDGVISDALGGLFEKNSEIETSAGTSTQTSYDTYADDDNYPDYGGAAAGITSAANIFNKDGTTGSGGADTSGTQTVEPGAGFQSLSQKQIAAEKETASALKHSECLKSLGAAALHDLLAASTQSIVNWINTGFDGDPLFIQDPRLFFKSMADQQVYTFVAELNDPVKYPFGAEIGASIATMYNCDRYSDSDNNCFNNTAIFTLGDDIGDNWQDFYTDFDVGGWGGWLSATQNPANNPIDFQFLASQEIQARINAQQSVIAKEISDNGGFLSLRKCVEYDDGMNAEIEQGGDYVETQTGTDGTFDASTFNYKYSYFGEIDGCKKYAVTTPGSVIADQLNIHLGVSAQAVALGDEVNTSIAAIFDALTNQLIEEGLASLDDDNVIVTQQIGGFGSNYISTNTIGSSWYVDPYAPADLHALLRCTSSETGEPIPNCVNQIDITESYLAALYESRDYLNNVILDSLITLDMHMPEPDLGWQTRMQQVLVEKTTEINNLKDIADLTIIIGPALGAVAAVIAAIPGVGAIGDAILFAGAALVAVVINLVENSDENVATGKAQAIAILNQRYENELKRIQYDIDNNNLPSAFQARIQRDKMIGYNEIYNTYVETITTQEQTLAILKQIEGDLGLTEAVTNGADGTRSIDILRASYSHIAGNIASQEVIDSVIFNQDLFEADLPLILEADATILEELQLQPFGGLDYTIPANLIHYAGEASIIGTIAYAIGDCTQSEKDQSGHCPVDRNESITYAPNGYHYSYGDGKKGKLENYNPRGDDFYIVEHEWWSFAGEKVIGHANAAHEPYTDDQRRMFAKDTADFLRLYPFGFTVSSPRQNPYSIFYPYPIPPISQSPWYYEKMYQRQPADGWLELGVDDLISGISEGDVCLALKPIDVPYGTCYGDNPLLIYTHMNPTGFNTFNYVPAEDKKEIDKEIYLNYFIDSYRNPGYHY